MRFLAVSDMLSWCRYSTEDRLLQPEIEPTAPENIRPPCAVAGHNLPTLRTVLQELFPRSYAQTADWLWRERTANQDTLARCQADLLAALEADPVLASLAASCQVRQPVHFDPDPA